MGVYIKGMEMPDGCTNCKLHKMAIYCILTHKKTDGSYKRHPDCPLIPVPPHGRLIDADALKADGFSSNGEMYISNLQIFHAPTIIPAEEGE